MHTQEDFLLFAHVWLDLSFEKGKKKSAFGESPSTQPPSQNGWVTYSEQGMDGEKNGSPLQKCPKSCGRMREVVGLFFVFVWFLSILQYVPTCRWFLSSFFAWLEPAYLPAYGTSRCYLSISKIWTTKKFYCLICQRLFRDCYGTDTKNLGTLYFNARSFSCKWLVTEHEQTD